MIPPLCVPSVSTSPGFTALTRIFRGPNSRDMTPVIASTATFTADVHRTARRGEPCRGGPDIDDVAAFLEVFRSCLGHHQQAQDVEIEVAMEMLRRDCLKRGEFVDARAVDQDAG